MKIINPPPQPPFGKGGLGGIEDIEGGFSKITSTRTKPKERG